MSSQLRGRSSPEPDTCRARRDTQRQREEESPEVSTEKREWRDEREQRASPGQRSVSLRGLRGQERGRKNTVRFKKGDGEGRELPVLFCRGSWRPGSNPHP